MSRTQDVGTLTARAALGVAAAALLAALALTLLAGGASAGHATAPTCGIAFSGDEGSAGWFRSPVQVSVTTTGGADYTNVSIDGGGFSPYTGPITVYGAWQHTVSCQASDHSGVSYTTSRTFSIDVSQPTCDGSYDGEYHPSGWYVGEGDWEITWSDDSNQRWFLNYTLDALGPYPYMGPFKLTDGTWRITCTITDLAGNTYTSTEYLPVDKSPPSACEITRVYDPGRGVDVPLRNGWYGVSSVSNYGSYIYLDAEDAGSGTRAFTLSRAGGTPVEIHNGSFLHLYGDGVHALSCVAEDRAGHRATYPLTISIDGTRPACQGKYTGTPGAGGWYTSGAFVLTASDEGSGLWFVNESVSGTVGSRELSGALVATSNLTREGLTTITCTAVDRSGLASSPATFQVRLDRTAPRCDATAVGTRGDGGWFVAPPRVFLNGSDNASGIAATHYRAGTDAERTYTSVLSLRDEGETTVACRVVDRAGNVGASNLTVRLDTVPPRVCLGLARDDDGNVIVSSRGAWFRRAISFDLAAKDDTSGIATARFRLDGRDVPGAQLRDHDASVTLRIDDRGEHVVTCEATDKAGNAARAVEVPVNIDDTQPTCDATPRGASQNGWLRGGASLELRASDTLSGLDGFRYAIDGAMERAYKQPIAIKGDGNHRVECIARDVAGNEARKTFDLRVDATPPECGWSDDVDALAVHAAPALVALRLHDNTSGDARAWYALNGAEERAYDGPIQLDRAGIHEVECRVVDAAGNERVVMLDRIRVEDAQREVPPAAVPMREEATAKTEAPIPGVEVALLVVALGALALARRRG